jgi:hypothetical protein
MPYSKTTPVALASRQSAPASRFYEATRLFGAFLVVLSLAGPSFAAGPDKFSTSPPEVAAEVCRGRVELLVLNLDRVLTEARSIDQVNNLLKQYFPISGCDAKEVERICRRSRFFHASDDSQAGMRIFVFDTRPDDLHRGLYVQFGLKTSTGESSLPFAKFKF